MHYFLAPAKSAGNHAASAENFSHPLSSYTIMTMLTCLLLYVRIPHCCTHAHCCLFSSSPIVSVKQPWKRGGGKTTRAVITNSRHARHYLKILPRYLQTLSRAQPFSNQAAEFFATRLQFQMQKAGGKSEVIIASACPAKYKVLCLTRERGELRSAPVRPRSVRPSLVM